MKTRTLLAFSALVLVGGARAQVPQIVNYQGRVAVGGVNFEGAGQFKFALVDGGTNAAATAHATASVDGTGHVKNVSVLIGGAGYTTPPTVTITDPGGLGSGAMATAVVSAGGVITAINVTNCGSNYGPPGPAVTIADPPPNYVYNTFWSNDGSVFSGSPNTEPSLAVPLTVTKGLYSVLLGDTTLANMTAIPSSVFANSDVRLRVWFNDGAHGSQLLTPDQRLAAVGYAMVAGGVPNGAITSSMLANGAVGGMQLASGLTLSGTTTGTFSGPLTGNVSGSAASFTGNLVGDVTGPQGATVVAKVGAVTAASVASGAILANAATNANTADTIVKRDASGNFSAGTITASSISAPNLFGAIFMTGMVNPNNLTPFWTSLNGDSIQTSNGPSFGPPMPVACTVTTLFLRLDGITAGANTVTATLYKNGVATTMTASATISTAGSFVTASDTTHTISVAAGDSLSIGYVQTNSVPIARIGVSTRCQ